MQGAAAIPGDVRGLLADVDTFISQTLKGENLSKKAKEKKDVLLKKIKEVKASYPQEFQDKERAIKNYDGNIRIQKTLQQRVVRADCEAKHVLREWPSPVTLQGWMLVAWVSSSLTNQLQLSRG